MPQAVDAEKVIHAARNSIPLTIKTYTLPHEMEVYLEQVLEIFLKELGQNALKDPLSYCLRELAVNAKKANTKRVYFHEKGLNILDDEQYKVGMERFKAETLDDIDHWLELQKKAGFYIKVIYQVRGQNLNLFVCNNAEITQKEQIRVYDRIARSRAFSSLEEALSTVLDDSEGAGLGIVIMVLMLKKLGLDEDAFDIDAKNGETIARLSIPMANVKVENMHILSKKIVDEIDSLPNFPDNIVRLQQMLSDPDSEITDMARQVSTDPALTADLLKTVNSAQFMLPKKVDNIVEAVKMVGLRGLKNLLYSYGTQKILGGTDDVKVKALWNHSYKTAFYAYNLVKNFLRKKEILDDVYVGGILHDMGKIVFSNVHPHLIEKIMKFSHEKEIPTELFEDMSVGLNHSQIGAMIAEKWNFPETLVNAIRYHHEPHNAPKEKQDVVSAVYLANMLCNYEDEVVSFDQFDKSVLALFRLQSEEQVKKILERLSYAFTQEGM
ncbi:MAG: HDOD domain-containing protein [Spirochaetales bacterium]|jgi:putative nucleotidyltransferase with HDIG domain|nr:HDOD domain-containing protein [Spirochaetales bacterium]